MQRLDIIAKLVILLSCYNSSFACMIIRKEPVLIQGGDQLIKTMWATMQEGQQFGLKLGTQTYQITLKRVEDGRVILARHDQEIVVPLRRK